MCDDLVSAVADSVRTTTSTLESTWLIADDALAELLATAVYYGPGFANHGPMVVEALEHQSLETAIPGFMKSYLPLLEAKERTAVPITDWEEVLRSQLVQLAPHGAAIAGHGLLRVAHSVRALSRFDSAVRRADLDEALSYWALRNGIAPERRIGGTATVDEILAHIPRLAPMSDELMLTSSLAKAAEDKRVGDLVLSLARPTDPLAFLDSLAMASVELYLRNDEGASFAFIHGVTVPTMARILVPYLDQNGLHALLSSVAGFVIYAVAGLDQSADEDRPVERQSLGEQFEVDADLATLAAATNDDHTIKFSDACLGLADRTGSATPLRALQVRIADTTE